MDRPRRSTTSNVASTSKTTTKFTPANDSDYESPEPSSRASSLGPFSETESHPTKRKHNQQPEKKPRQPPKKKPRRVAHPADDELVVLRSKTRTGKLQHFFDLPMDLLFEILGHLSPVDLLHLARTVKPLRAMLMQRSTASLWKGAHAHAVPEPLPECPEGMEEPAWVSLVYDTGCMHCGAGPKARTVLWAYRVRCCQKCLKTEYITNVEVDMELYELEIIEEHYLVEREPEWLSKFVIHHEDLRSVYLPSRYRITDVENLFATVDALPGGESGFEAWSLTREQEISDVLAHARKCVLWDKARVNVRADEIDRIRTQRKDAILAKLVSIGWGDEIELLTTGRKYIFFQQDVFKTLRPLTDKAWNGMRQGLVESLESAKADRLALEVSSNKARAFKGTRTRAV